MQIKLLKALAPWAIIGVLIIALSVVTCSKQTIKEENHESELRQAIEVEKRHSVELQNEGEALKQKIKQDSLKSKAVVIALESKIKVLTKEVKKSREIAQPEIDKSPALTEFVSDVDSLDIAQGAIIDSLKSYNVRQWRSFNSLLSIEQEKTQVQTELNSHFVDLNIQVSRQLKKERRKKTFFKITTGIIAGVLLYEVVTN